MDIKVPVAEGQIPSVATKMSVGIGREARDRLTLSDLGL